MKELQVEQGTVQWREARAGVVTASCLDKIIRPSDGKLSASWPKYMARLLCEWYTGNPMDDYVSAHMERGTALEDEARSWYSFDSGNDVRRAGFCLTDDGAAGCSPDGLIAEDGGLELKTPGIEQHMLYVLDDGRSLVADYKCQIQGCLWVTGRKWWDAASFSPVLPSVRVRVERDGEFLEAMAAAVGQLNEKLDAAKRKLAPLKADRDRALARAAEDVDTGF